MNAYDRTGGPLVRRATHRLRIGRGGADVAGLASGFAERAPISFPIISWASVLASMATLTLALAEDAHTVAVCADGNPLKALKGTGYASPAVPLRGVGGLLQ